MRTLGSAIGTRKRASITMGSIFPPVEKSFGASRAASVDDCGKLTTLLQFKAVLNGGVA
jgi:hypothetical protein